MLQLPTFMSWRITSVREETSLETATAFPVRRGGRTFLIANYHVVSGRNPNTGQFNKNCERLGLTPDRLKLEFVMLWNGAPASWNEASVPVRSFPDEYTECALWLEHPLYGRDVDVVAIELDPSLCDVVSTYSADVPSPFLSPQVNVTDELSIIGFPFGLDSESPAVWTRGSVASEPDLNYDGLPRFLVDSRTRPGQSGSPVISFSASTSSGIQPNGHFEVPRGTAGDLVGVYSGRITAESDLGYVWHRSLLPEIIDGACVGTPGVEPN